MIEFRKLGLLDLRAGDGREIRAVLQQPKRLGLLAYLSVSRPHRFHRRDTLLALFWPGLDQEHARAALRRSLYFLRSELGPDAISGPGDEEIAVPEEVLWCDTTAVNRALSSGDITVVLDLYRGTFSSPSPHPSSLRHLSGTFGPSCCVRREERKKQPDGTPRLQNGPRMS
jgi:hypothetical protein